VSRPIICWIAASTDSSDSRRCALTSVSASISHGCNAGGRTGLSLTSASLNAGLTSSGRSAKASRNSSATFGVLYLVEP